MPVEIRELRITTEVSEQAEQYRPATNSPTMSASDREKLIQACIERVFEALKRNSEK